MSRQPKLSTPPAVAPVADEKYTTQVRTYQVITALYGGGVEPAHADPITTVRATEIRGHLRFWWRACRAAGFADAQALKKREAEIWGSTEQPSAVLVYCDVTSLGQPEIAYTVVRNERNNKPRLQESAKLPKYASFPLQPDKTELNQIGWKSEPVLMNVGFTLHLTYPKALETELQAALWAWETFGGVGARTRRGFGALQCTGPVETLPVTAEEVQRQLVTRLKDPAYVATGAGNPDVPKLNPLMKLKIVAATANAESSWRSLIDKLNQFRQARFGSKYGMSQWPEANAIRKLNGQGIKAAKTSTGTPFAPPIDIAKYPRAAFGLPIIFHLPHDRLEETLETVEEDRLSSPLILRPLLCQGGKAVGLAAVLDTPQVPGSGLELQGRKKTPVRSDLTPAEAKQIPPLKGNPDVIDAFLKTL